VYVPAKQPWDGTELSDDIPAHNRLPRGPRFQDERGFALPFVRWKALAHVTMSPRGSGDLRHAATVLTHFEHKAAVGRIRSVSSRSAPSASAMSWP
jgi:hypothetical protein